MEIESKEPPKEDFFDKDDLHGLVKRILYKKYLQAYIPKTQNEKEKYSFKTIIIDGFSGTGRYGMKWPNKIEKYGSPLIAVMVSLDFCHRKNSDGEEALTWRHKKSTKEPQDELIELIKFIEELGGKCRTTTITGDRKYDIHMYFVEMNEKNYTKLKNNVELVVLRFLWENYPNHQYAAFAEERNIKKIVIDTKPFSICIEMIRCEFSSFDPPKDLTGEYTRSLTFLDPFGYTQTPMNRVGLFASKPGNEVLINFMSSFVNRFVSRNPQEVIKLFGMEDLVGVAQLYGLEEPNLESKELADFVKSIIHSCDQGNAQGLRNNICKVTSNYEEFLKKKTECKFLQSFEIINKNNTTLYHLIHITNHIKGLEAMKESMNRCSQTEGQMKMSDYQVLRMGHMLNFGNQDNQDTVALAIHKRFAGEEDVAIDSIRAFVLLETPYVFRKEPLAKLQEDGRITRVTGPNGEKQKSKNTFPDSVKWFCSFRSDETEEDDELSSIAAKLSMKK